MNYECCFERVGRYILRSKENPAKDVVVVSPEVPPEWYINNMKHVYSIGPDEVAQNMGYKHGVKFFMQMDLVNSFISIGHRQCVLHCPGFENTIIKVIRTISIGKECVVCVDPRLAAYFAIAYALLLQAIVPNYDTKPIEYDLLVPSDPRGRFRYYRMDNPNSKQKNQTR